jgi:hypothetical protein
MVEAVMKQLELGYYEVKFAFEGLADDHVWKRPAPGLLSVGEIAGHVAFWEAVRLAGEGEDPEKCRVSSPLIDPRFRYLPDTLETPPTEQHLAMTAEQVCGELLRVHGEAVAHFKALNPDPESKLPGSFAGMEWTYGAAVEYLAFHVAYHTGQMFSARHLLGEETPDN